MKNMKRLRHLLTKNIRSDSTLLLLASPAYYCGNQECYGAQNDDSEAKTEQERKF